MRKLFVLSGVVLACASVVGVLVGSATGAPRPVPANLGPACYPGNNMSIVNGSGFMGARVTAATNVEVDGVPSVDPNAEFPGTAFVQMYYDVTGNGPYSTSPDGSTLTGNLKIDFTINGRKGTFTSSCIQEAQTESPGTDEDTGKPETNGFEAEFEGTVTGAPWSKGPTAAVGSIHGHRVAGGVAIAFSIEKGVTGAETGGEINASNQVSAGDHQKTSGSLKSSNSNAGACSSTSSGSNYCGTFDF